MLKLPAFVVHLVLFSFVVFSAFTKFWLIRVAAQPESSKILMLFQMIGSLLPLMVAIYPIVMDDNCSTFDFLLGLSNNAVELKYS